MIRRWVTPRVTEEDQPTGFDSFDLRLGDVMRGERATLGKSLLDVQRELKIKATYIAAIENADATAFETPGFIAGYVRSYARYLKMDPDWCFRVFCAESGFVPMHGLATLDQSKAEKSKPVHEGDPLSNPNASFVPRRTPILERIEPAAVGSVVVLIALVGVLGYGGVSVLKEIQKVRFTPVEQAVGVMDEMPDLSGVGAMAADAGEGAGLASPPSAEALDRLYRPQALDVPVLIARDGPISTLDPRDVGVLAGDQQRLAEGAVVPDQPAPGAVTETEAAPVLADAGGVRVFGPDAPEVAIFAVRPSWVRVQAADGSVILEKILDAGEKYVLPNLEAPPVLRSGNAGSVYFAVNGTAYGPAGEGPSVVKNIALSPEALSGAYAVADIEADAALADFIAVAQAQQ